MINIIFKQFFGRKKTDKYYFIFLDKKWSKFSK